VDSSLAGEVQREVDEQPRAETGGAVVQPLLGGARLRGARDVEMRPGLAPDELLQEECGGDAARVHASHVAQIGDRRVEFRTVTVCQWQLPDLLVHPFGGGLDPVDQCLIVAEDSGDLSAESAHGRAGESCDIDDGVDRLLGGQHESIGHHHASFGVGVDHFNGLAATHDDNVAQPQRRTRRHVVGAHQIAGDLGLAA